MTTSPDGTLYYQHQRSGLGSVGSYQVAGTPFMTGSTITAGEEVEIKFPTVTRSITIINKDAANDDIRVHFQSKDAARTIAGVHYITLADQNSSLTMNIKCNSVYLSAPGSAATFEMFAELTGINPQNMFPLTGSGIDE
ncbi:MAG TPA: hypothetical protein DCL39_07075 [Alteromonas macleodii]|nr:hypothetical protein [Alteromonas macleodii]|tara:strand:- start:237 stop:653 length:417 start_codon:yes stop_codon:yes gene_type:complete